MFPSFLARDSCSLSPHTHTQSPLPRGYAALSSLSSSGTHSLVRGLISCICGVLEVERKSHITYMRCKWIRRS